MTERLTAFEFLAATDAPQLVRLTNQGVAVLELHVIGWVGVSLPSGLTFETRADLVIEGQGLGHPYWDDAVVPWTMGFDPRAEARRIGTLRVAVRRELNRAALALM